MRVNFAKVFSSEKFHNVHFVWFMTIIIIIPNEFLLSLSRFSAIDSEDQLNSILLNVFCISHSLSHHSTPEGLIRIYNNEKNTRTTTMRDGKFSFCDFHTTTSMHNDLKKALLIFCKERFFFFFLFSLSAAATP